MLFSSIIYGRGNLTVLLYTARYKSWEMTWEIWWTCSGGVSKYSSKVHNYFQDIFLCLKIIFCVDQIHLALLLIIGFQLNVIFLKRTFIKAQPRQIEMSWKKEIDSHTNPLEWNPTCQSDSRSWEVTAGSQRVCCLSILRYLRIP